MANTTKVSPYRSGSPRFGLKSHQSFDNSVKISYLSPEELEEYRSGKRGGSKMYTREDYEKMKAAGINNQDIAKTMGISVATLYNRIKVWKGESLTQTAENQNNAQIRQENLPETNTIVQDKTAEYEQVVAEIKAKMESSSKEKDEIIQGLKKDMEFWKQRAETIQQQDEEVHPLTVTQLDEQLSDKNQQITDLQAALKQTTIDHSNLHIKVLNLEHELREKFKQHQDLQAKYNELLEDYCNLKEEITPLRQLVLIGIRERVGVLT